MSIGKVGACAWFMRSVATVVLVTYSALIASPAVQAAQQFSAQRQALQQAEHDERVNLGKSLSRAKDQLRQLADRPATNGIRASSERKRIAKEKLRAWRSQFDTQKREILAEFETTGELIRSKNLAPAIRDRHSAALAKFQSEIAAFERDADAALASEDEATIQASAAAALQRLDAAPLGRRHQSFDPGNLPNSVLKPDRTRTPRTTPEDFQAALLTGEPGARLAQATGLDLSQLPDAANPNYLAPTVEVVLGPDIQAKAQELHHSPVEIYHWVRNNVHWQPTWGAIQNASHTLASRRGNAFDIASLTIALLRASDIPARYVHGTIEVPEDRFRNWAGGFEHIDAAVDFASAGGIPITSVISGGRVTKIRIEHIWVEAALDFQPSRGVINRSADSWVALDPSFKQIEVVPALDAIQIAGIDAAGLTQQFVASGTVNSAEGWATGFDAGLLQNAQVQARQALAAHIEQNLPDATALEVVGGRRILQQTAPVLAASLPNRIVVIGTRTAAVPPALQQRMTFALGKDVIGDPIDPQTFAWAQLNDKQITLSFRPASEADREALSALLPEGDITDALQFPAAIPAYLIRVVPELKIDGAVVLSGAAIALGTDVNLVFNPTFVTGGTKAFSYTVPAGSYLAIAALGGSIDTQTVRDVKNRLNDAVAALQSGDPARVDALGRERLLGDLFQAGVLGYYSQYLSYAQLAGAQKGGHYSLAAGLGSIGYEVSVDTFFGVPRTIRTGLIGLNIPIVNIVGHDSVGGSERAEFARLLGTISSALESAVPQTLYTSTAFPADAISAVEALAVAGSQGQQVYAGGAEIDPAVFASYPAEARSELSNALRNGMQVSVHGSAVSIPGWYGFGYIIEDPVTGAGAYKISGGANGGMMGFLENVNDATRIARILFYLTNWIGEDAQKSLGAFAAFMGMLTGTATILDDCIAVASSAQIGILIGIQLMLSIALTFVPGGFLFRLVVNHILTEIVRGFMEALKYLAGCRNEF